MPASNPNQQIHFSNNRFNHNQFLGSLFPDSSQEQQSGVNRPEAVMSKTAPKSSNTGVAWMFIISFILLISIQAISYQSLKQAEETRVQANRSADISRQLEILMSNMKDLETGVRGYALTDHQAFLEPYTAALPKIRQNIQTLEQLLQDDPLATELDQLEQLAEQRIQIAQSIVRLQDTQGVTTAMHAIQKGSGRQAMDALRQQVSTLQERIDTLSQQSSARAARTIETSRLLFAFGLLMAISLQGGALFLLSREARQRKQAEATLSVTNQQLALHLQELDKEIIDRKNAERQIQKLNAALEEKLTLLNKTNDNLNAVNKELESFAYSVSHDLRSPLRGIDGFSQAVLEDYGNLIDARGVDYLQRIRKESQRMGELIDGILSLSRLTRGEIHKEPVQLSDIASQIAADLIAQEPDRQVTFDIQPNIQAQAEPRLIQAVLQNLLNNAWKFTSKHSTAQIQFGAFTKEDKPIYFVKDDGAGFDMQYIGKLFGTFQRLHGANEFPGSGIGLATVQRIINRHGGTIWAEGAPDQGATFYFTLS